MSTDRSGGSPPGQTAGAGGDWRAARRQHLLDAARSVFLRDGYRGATMERVAEEAGVSKQTLYNNFGDKEELFTALLERKSETDLADAIAAAIASAAHADPAQAMRQAAEAVVRRGLDSEFVGLHRIIIELAAELPEVKLRVHERVFLKSVTALQAAIEQGMANGTLAPGDAEALAYILFGISAATGLFRAGSAGGSTTEPLPVRMATALGEVLAHGLLAQPGMRARS
ncbi:MAG TPA: TetR/AcrR family transcriptional regulator [Dehalococcoidia bacterium]|nr:TetR/AcrR family transcriptional regulator [Dehalococcoidia bacterium]